MNVAKGALDNFATYNNKIYDNVGATHSHLSCSMHLLQVQPWAYLEQPEGMME